MKDYSLIFFLIIIQFYSINNSIFDYSHEKGEPLNIIAGSLSSRMNIIPYGYTKLNICQSEKIVQAEDTLAEILTGEKFYTTNYVAQTDENEFCKILCYNNFSKKSVDLFRKLISRKYSTNWILDKLPAGLINFDKIKKKSSLEYSKGIPLGFRKGKEFYLYNHFQFNILLNKIDEDKYNVVGFNVLPMSIKHNGEKPICAKNIAQITKNLEMEEQPLQEGNILFTYDVIFQYSDLTLASRWDHFKESKAKIHWTGFVISEILIICTSIIIIFILYKNLRTEISSYNYRVSQFEDIKEYDWKQLSGDVFRYPTNPMLFSSILGTGFQLYLTLLSTFFFGFFWFANPEKRKNLLNLGIIFFYLMGFAGGYISSIFYKFWGGKNWIRVSILTSLLFPGSVIFGYILLNIILTIEKSNAAVSFLDILSLFSIWFFCTLPLILIGGFFGAKTKGIKVPCKVNRIPSEIPEKPWYLHYKYNTFIFGFVGFATIFIEFSYVMSALWNHEIYLLASYFWISFLIFVIVSSEISILVVFFNLARGDYKWWWKSFIMGGSPVLYLFLYSVCYFFYMKISSPAAIIIYFGLMEFILVIIFLVCGTMAVFFNFSFIKFMYSKIKID